MGVGPNKKTAGEGVVLEKDLVDDTRAGLPETDVVLGAGRGKEVVNLLVDSDCPLKILGTADLRLDQVIAVYSRGVGDGRHTSRHELQDRHLRGGVLTGDAVGTKLQVGRAPLNILAVRVIEVRVQDLLGVRQRAVKTAPDDCQVLGHLLVIYEVALFMVVLLDLLRDMDVSIESR